MLLAIPIIAFSICSIRAFSQDSSDLGGFDYPPSLREKIAKYRSDKATTLQLPDEYERDLAQARENYALSRTMAQAAGAGAYVVDKASGLAPGRGVPLTVVTMGFEAVEKGFQVRANSLYRTTIDVTKIIEHRVEYSREYQNATNEVEKRAIADKIARSTLKSELVAQYDGLEADHKLSFGKGYMEAMLQYAERTDQDVNELFRQTEDLRTDSVKVWGNIRELRKQSERFEAFTRSTARFMQETDKRITGISSSVAVLNDRISHMDQRQALMLRTQYASLSGQDKLAWLEQKALEFSPDEEARERIRVQAQLTRETAIQTAREFEGFAKEAAAGVELLGTLGLAKGKDLKHLQTASRLLQGGAAVFASYATGNYFQAALALGGMFKQGSGGDAGHAAIMAELKVIRQMLEQISEQLDRIESKMEKFHKEAMEQFLVQRLQGSQTLRIVASASLADAMVSLDRLREMVSAPNTEGFMAAMSPPGSRINGSAFVETLSIVVAPDPIRENNQQGIWGMGFGSERGDVTAGTVLYSWSNGVLKAYSLVNQLSKEEYYRGLPRILNPRALSIPADHMMGEDKEYWMARAAELFNETLLNTTQVATLLDGFLRLEAFEPVLSQPAVLDSSRPPPSRSELNATYSRSITFLDRARTMLEDALLQEALIAGSGICDSIVDAVFFDAKRFGDPARHSLVTVLERAHPQVAWEFVRKDLKLQDKDPIGQLWEDAAQERSGSTLVDPSSGEPLLQTLTENVARAFVLRRLKERGAGLTAYYSAWTAPKPMPGQTDALVMLLGKPSEWVPPLTVPSALAKDFSHEFVLTRRPEEGPTAYTVYRKIELPGKGKAYMRPLFHLPAPAELFRVKDVGVLVANPNPIFGPVYHRLADLHGRVVDRLAELHLARDHPESLLLIGLFGDDPLLK